MQIVAGALVGAVTFQFPRKAQVFRVVRAVIKLCEQMIGRKIHLRAANVHQPPAGIAIERAKEQAGRAFHRLKQRWIPGDIVPAEQPGHDMVVSPGVPGLKRLALHVAVSLRRGPAGQL